jgi:hypothetical protein
VDATLIDARPPLLYKPRMSSAITRMSILASPRETAMAGVLRAR